MFRKSIIALAATTALAIAALPTTAMAKKGKHHHGYRGHHGHFHFGHGYTSCYRHYWVETRRGWRKVVVNVCNDDDD